MLFMISQNSVSDDSETDAVTVHRWCLQWWMMFANLESAAVAESLFFIPKCPQNLMGYVTECVCGSSMYTDAVCDSQELKRAHELLGFLIYRWCLWFINVRWCLWFKELHHTSMVLATPWSAYMLLWVLIVQMVFSPHRTDGFFGLYKCRDAFVISWHRWCLWFIKVLQWCLWFLCSVIYAYQSTTLMFTCSKRLYDHECVLFQML